MTPRTRMHGLELLRFYWPYLRTNRRWLALVVCVGASVAVIAAAQPRISGSLFTLLSRGTSADVAAYIGVVAAFAGLALLAMVAGAANSYVTSQLLGEARWCSSRTC